MELQLSQLAPQQQVTQLAPQQVTQSTSERQVTQTNNLSRLMAVVSRSEVRVQEASSDRDAEIVQLMRQMLSTINVLSEENLQLRISLEATHSQNRELNVLFESHTRALAEQYETFQQTQRAMNEDINKLKKELNSLKSGLANLKTGPTIVIPPKGDVWSSSRPYLQATTTTVNQLLGELNKLGTDK